MPPGLSVFFADSLRGHVASLALFLPVVKRFRGFCTLSETQPAQILLSDVWDAGRWPRLAFCQPWAVVIFGKSPMPVNPTRDCSTKNPRLKVRQPWLPTPPCQQVSRVLSPAQARSRRPSLDCRSGRSFDKLRMASEV